LLEYIEVIRGRISKTWSIENYQFFISMSIGVVCYPFDGKDTTILLKNADIAMYEAKREGKNRVLFYQEKINDQNFRLMKMINELQYGIDQEQFVLFYQPQFDLNTGDINGLEALVRWIHPEDGFISPGEFIPVAEESGQIFKLERWIIAKALEQKSILEQQGFTELIMSINLSGKTLTSEINFIELEQIIVNAKVDYSKVVIEITETANISDVDIVIKHLSRLKALGIRVALDDFGTGYSSLNYLKKFPINMIKLDKSFIDAIIENGIDTLLIKNILTLAHDLDFEVIAEGIETREQLDFLKLHYCGSGQGYLLGRPAPEEKIHELLVTHFRYEV
jgi:EAL domain-containing protein (putative c-di-GMP-specific phosphodiesterase class I)